MKIKFYSVNDMSIGNYLIEAEKVLKEYSKGKEVEGINDIIELYIINKFFDNKVYLSKWTSEEISFYANMAKSYMKEIAIYFKEIADINFTDLYNEVDIVYKHEFWELINKFNVYENISQDIFQRFISKSNIKLHQLLRYKDIVKYFGDIIRRYMLNDSLTAELLLDEYEIRHTGERKALYFPKELSTGDKEDIIDRYIDSEDSNLNYLWLIANIQSSKNKISISSKMLLKAKRVAEQKEKDLFLGNTGVLFETQVVFSGTQNEALIIHDVGKLTHISYSAKWIKENTDYPTLLNNFIYLFGLVDLQMRCTLVNKFNTMGVFERFVLTSSRNSYITGMAFEQMNILSNLQIIGYYRELFSNGIRLEEIIEWFFKRYLTDEFDLCKFNITMPSTHSTYLEKCTNIMPALESILKQFSLFVEEGEIDFELLEIRSEQLIYKDIPSLVDKKYVYGFGDEFEKATYLLYSDQSGLGYDAKSKQSYDNFFDLLSKRKVKIDDYPGYCSSKINWLEKNDYLKYDPEGFIIFSDISLIIILKDLYYNEVICYWKYPNKIRKKIDKLESNKVVSFESSLFSRPEQDYINYFLNKSQFNNGPDLRNKYSHTQPISDSDVKLHKQNYMIFLKIFIIVVIKINDDICTLEEIKNINIVTKGAR